MKYTMKSGVLYSQNKMITRIKSSLMGPEKEVLSPEGACLFQTNIRNLEAPRDRMGDVRFREYVMLDKDQNEYAVAKPDYAEGEDPFLAGWPVFRTPRVEHARFFIGETEFCLFMKNNQNYILNQLDGKTVVQIFHKGLIGGWDIEAADSFSPELICGIFIFCRYLEQENEFFIV